MTKNVFVDIEVQDAGRKEHYPTTLEDLTSFLKTKFKEFDGDYVKIQSKEINLVNLYEDFNLEDVLSEILNNKNPSTIEINEYKNCIVLFFIKTKSMDEVKIYVSIG